MQVENPSSAFRTVVLTNADGKQQVLHIHQDSDSKLEALFDPSEMFQSVPYKDRNLPTSFFNPPNQGRRPYHYHSRSTGVLDMTMPNTKMLDDSNSELQHKNALSNNNCNNNNATHLMLPEIDKRFYNPTLHPTISHHTKHFDSPLSRRIRFPKADRKRAFNSQVISGCSNLNSRHLQVFRYLLKTGTY